MEFNFSKRNLIGKEAKLERFFEILPGFASWTILAGMVGISFWNPLLAAILIIAFDFYWLLRMFYMTFFLVLAYLRLSTERKVDWMGRIQELEYSKDPLVSSLPFRQRISQWIHRRNLNVLSRSGSPPPPLREIYHLIIFPVVREAGEVIEPGIKSLIHQEFPPKQMVVVIALEARAEENIKKQMRLIQERYKNFFFDFLITTHPDNLPGEARVKGANVTYAAKEAARFFDSKQIPFDHVIVSCFDADTVVSERYFSCLAYHFMVCPKRNRAGFQPIPVYHNNIWEASAFARVLDIGSSFFQLIESTNPEKLVTFSSHSMSFKALVEVGYWPVDMVSDDSAIFWKALIHFDGDYHVIPMYVTLSMDVVSGPTWWQTITNVYHQKRRWAWGVENFPIVMRAFLKADKISLYDKVTHGFKLFEDHVAWATWPFLLTFISWLPALFAGREFSDSVLYYSAPRITATIFNLAFLALFVTIIVSLYLLPKQKVKNPFWKRVALVLEWLLIPIVIVFLSALPALDAQTRLMFGRYMEFWVTEKKREPKA